MKLTNEQVQQLFSGTLCFEQEEGWLLPKRFTPKQMEVYEKGEAYYVRAIHTAGIQIRFCTDATFVGFRYWVRQIVNNYSIDVFVDDVEFQVFVPPLEQEQGYFSCRLPEGKKKVTIYFPGYSQLLIRDFEINAPYSPVKLKDKVLWIGDSITQGGYAVMSGYSYVSTAARLLGWDVISQGVGGMPFDCRFLEVCDGFKPDKILVALGTNGCNSESFNEDVKAYFEKLERLYPGIPTIVITPLWRNDDLCACLERNFEKIKEVCSMYTNIRLIDGFSLVPHIDQMFHDGLHPNDMGSMIYGMNLAKQIAALER